MPSPADSLQPNWPILGWANFQGAAAAGLPAVDELPHVQRVTSGRAALWAAVRALQLPAGSTILAPSYHCPTLVGPLRLAGHPVRFYPLTADGLPRLEGLAAAPDVSAIVVAQLFGLPRSLAAVRAWCDEHRVALIEDCAHSFFGQAGARAVGHWGDVATASLSKFFPVPEGGLLAAQRPLPTLSLRPAGLRGQVKTWIDTLEKSSRYGRLTGLNTALEALWRLKNGPPRPRVVSAEMPPPPTETELMHEVDLDRCDQALPGLSRWLHGHLPRERIVARRQQHYRLLHQLCQGLSSAQPLFDNAELADCAPYVMPLLVDAAKADSLYLRLRVEGFAVFRWDRIWPGVQPDPDDHGQRWQRGVLQLLCHQDLDEAGLRRTAAVIAAHD